MILGIKHKQKVTSLSTEYSGSIIPAKILGEIITSSLSQSENSATIIPGKEYS